MANRPKNPLPKFDPGTLESICKILGDTSEGLTGSEIENFLHQIDVRDVAPGATKWIRLHNALVQAQNDTGVGNHVILFVSRAMQPGRYTKEPHKFRARQDPLNVVLAMAGYSLKDNGQIVKQSKAETLDQAHERCNRLRAELTRRGVHAEVMTYCDVLLRQNNYFHAVLEAMKSISSRIQRFTGLTPDGAQLMSDAFSMGKSVNPRFCISDLKSETEQGEQRGFVNLVTGMFGVFRNPAAHAPVIEWPMSEQDALDMMTTISYVHRKLDRMKPFPGYQPPP